MSDGVPLMKFSPILEIWRSQPCSDAFSPEVTTGVDTSILHWDSRRRRPSDWKVGNYVADLLHRLRNFLQKKTGHQGLVSSDKRRKIHFWCQPKYLNKYLNRKQILSAKLTIVIFEFHVFMIVEFHVYFLIDCCNQIWQPHSLTIFTNMAIIQSRGLLIPFGLHKQF